MYTNESQIGPHYSYPRKTDSGIIRNILQTNQNLFQCKEVLGSRQHINLELKKRSSVESFFSQIRNASIYALCIIFYGLIIVPMELYFCIKYR